jgi:two-component system response regulator AtoC
VLLLGETGTGKEVIARSLHVRSRRFARPFLKLNCAAVPSELVESELFGHEKGAFTGADRRKLGLFELADGGTVFLDEIGDMQFRLQAKLLQVLQDQEFRRVGGYDVVRVDVRVIAATHCNLVQAISQERFRQDLYYRLNVCSLQIPSLRERKEDIIALAKFLFERHGGQDWSGLLTDDLAAALREYSWPGNVRELENEIRKLAALRNPAAIARDLRARAAATPAAASPAAASPAPAPASVREPVRRFDDLVKRHEQLETETILNSLQACQWNRKRAAEQLGIDYKALLYKMKKLNIGLPSPAGGSKDHGSHELARA